MSNLAIRLLGVALICTTGLVIKYNPALAVFMAMAGGVLTAAAAALHTGGRP